MRTADVTEPVPLPPELDLQLSLVQVMNLTQQLLWCLHLALALSLSVQLP